MVHNGLKLFQSNHSSFLCTCVSMKSFHTMYFDQDYLVQTHVSGNKNIDIPMSFLLLGDFNPLHFSGNLKMSFQNGFVFSPYFAT